jgi:hypothetical protein
MKPLLELTYLVALSVAFATISGSPTVMTNTLIGYVLFEVLKQKYSAVKS